MSTKLCKFGCGLYLEWHETLNCYVNAGTHIKHICPSFWKGSSQTGVQLTATSSQSNLETTLAELAQAFINSINSRLLSFQLRLEIVDGK